MCWYMYNMYMLLFVDPLVEHETRTRGDAIVSYTALRESLDSLSSLSVSLS